MSPRKTRTAKRGIKPHATKGELLEHDQVQQDGTAADGLDSSRKASDKPRDTSNPKRREESASSRNPKIKRRRKEDDFGGVFSPNQPRRLPTLLPLGFKNKSKLAKAFLAGPTPTAKTKLAKRETRRRSATGLATIEAKQLKLPVSFTSDATKLASLREYIDDNVATLSRSQLTYEQRAAITLKRISKTAGYKVNVLTAGEVSKRRALAEINANTQLGKSLVNLENQIIEHLVYLASKK